MGEGEERGRRIGSTLIAPLSHSHTDFTDPFLDDSLSLSHSPSPSPPWPNLSTRDHEQLHYAEALQYITQGLSCANPDSIPILRFSGEQMRIIEVC